MGYAVQSTDEKYRMNGPNCWIGYFLSGLRRVLQSKVFRFRQMRSEGEPEGGGMIAGPDRSDAISIPLLIEASQPQFSISALLRERCKQHSLDDEMPREPRR